MGLKRLRLIGGLLGIDGRQAKTSVSKLPFCIPEEKTQSKSI
jgi:hypothetical protein